MQVFWAAALMFILGIDAGRQILQNVPDAPPVPTTVDSVAWGSSGFLSAYHTGVMHALLRANVLGWGSNPGAAYAGTGEGAIVAVAGLAGHNPMRILAEIEFAMQATVTEIQNCWETEGVPASCRIAGRYEGYIKRLLQALIRSTTPSAVNSTMSVQLSLVPGLEESKPLPFEECNDLEDKGFKVNTFMDRRDLESALLASNFFPEFSTMPSNCTHTFRDRQYKNGERTAPVPCPVGAQHCIKVSAVPNEVAVQLGWDVIQPGSATADIYPGYSGSPLPFPLSAWSEMMWNPVAVLPFVNKLYSLGFTDGRTWARLNNFVSS